MVLLIELCSFNMDMNKTGYESFECYRIKCSFRFYSVEKHKRPFVV